MNSVKILNPRFFLLVALIVIGYAEKINAFELVKNNLHSAVFLSETEVECVKLAVNDLVSDVQKISGVKLEVVHSLKGISAPYILVGSVSDKGFTKQLKALGLSATETLKGKWEAYRVESVNPNVLVMAGSDERGTMFAVYDFIEQYLKVDPLYFWSGIEPEKKTELSWESVKIVSDGPTFKYRGWFINDEDLLTEWKDVGGRRNIDYPFYKQVVAPDVMEHVVEAMVRSRFNLIIPASFLDIGNPAEEELVKVAARRGVFLSQHHIEPLGVSAFTYFNYWKAKNGSNPLFSYFSNKAELMEVWNVYAEKWAKYPNVIWQIGLRGIGDRPMWMADLNIPQTDADRGQIITDALKAQIEIIQSVDKRKNAPTTMTLWAEGSYLFHEGHLKIPEQTMIIFSDNSPGWKFQDDFYSIAREPSRKYGVYYHHQLWGSGPHLAQAVPPAQTYKVLNEAVKKHSHEYVIMNVSNIREFLPGIAASSQMLYNFQEFNPDKFLSRWCKERFPSSPEKVKKMYDDYFVSFALHDERHVPMLLDGQTNGPTGKVLSEIEQLLKKSKKTMESGEKEQTDTKRKLEQSWAAKSLGDMHPQAKSAEEWLQKARSQRLAFSKVVYETELLLNQLSGDEAILIKSNLLSHAYFMRGLSQRLEYAVLAKMALEQGDHSACITNLKLAAESFSDIRKAKILGSQGKWTDWYRGDKKMNLQQKEKDMQRILDLCIEKLN